MRIPSLTIFVAAIGVGLWTSRSAVSAPVILGDPPTAPEDVSGLPTGISILSVTGGFSVNANSREQVRSFYNSVYLASDGVPMFTTSDVATCTPGTNSTAFKEAVLRRINWFRAMAGMPAAVTLDPTLNAKDQEAAVIMSRNGALSHHPPTSWSCYTGNGDNAASNSNIAIGNAGADAISAYIWDFGANNYEVGHRRWLFYPQTQVMGTGDVPAASGFNSANATWVFDGNFGGPRPATRTPYVAWPPAGYLPYPLAYPQWSFALTNANLSAATVSMKSNGVSVAVSLQPYLNGYGENTLVWVPMGLDATSEATTFPFSGTDTVYTITVTNIQYSTVTTGFTYTVTLFDPTVPGADYAPTTISGTANPGVGQANAYSFTPITNATSYEWRVTRPSGYTLNDGAENGLTNVTVNASAGYVVRDSSVAAAGSYSYHLAHPTPPTDQFLTLNQAFVPKTNATLSIRSRLGYASEVQVARVQVSTDSGSSWADIYSQSGSDGPGELSFTTRPFGLSAYSNREIRLRFKYEIGNGSYYPQTSAGVGWYLDDIIVTNAEVWTVLGTNTVATTNFTFTPPQTTNYNLDVRAYLFTEFPLGWGPAKYVTAIVAPPVITMSPPVVSSGQVLLDFTTTAYASFKLLQADQLTGAWTTNAAATLTTNVAGNSYRFTTQVGPSARFYRVKSP
ncbi:MAG: CAP domain-containing protein [Verrucomicrobiota bacterium]|nr:hypothetical protein [Limisphaerales bacterium]